MDRFLQRDFLFETNVGPMANSVELDHLREEVKTSTLPDVVFGKATLQIHSDWVSLTLCAAQGLGGSHIHNTYTDEEWRRSNAPSLHSPEVRGKILGTLRVQAASSWIRSNNRPGLGTVAYSNDWTYTTSYWGDMQFSENVRESVIVGPNCSESFLPWELLKSTNPKLIFFKEIPLWEDELSDNGKSKLSCKIRVMDSFFYILQTFELRIDGVLQSRSIETRIFHHFDSSSVLREFRWIEEGVEKLDLRAQQTFTYDPHS